MNEKKPLLVHLARLYLYSGVAIITASFTVPSMMTQYFKNSLQSFIIVSLLTILLYIVYLLVNHYVIVKRQLLQVRYVNTFNIMLGLAIISLVVVTTMRLYFRQVLYCIYEFLEYLWILLFILTIFIIMRLMVIVFRQR